jgi:hypothetical protein
MKNEKVFEPFGLQEFYVDGFGNFHLANGIMRCAAFTQQPAPGGRTPKHRGFQADHSGSRRANFC